MAAPAEPAGPPRHSMHGKMFTHIYAECLKPINEIQHCKRTQGPAHPDCIVQWDELFLCYTEANCPTRYAKADKCIKESGRENCTLELAELSVCARYFWKVMRAPEVEKVMDELSGSESACLDHRIALRKCTVDATATGDSPKVCRALDEKLRDCYLRALNPLVWKEYEACTSGGKDKDCSEVRRRLDETLLKQSDRLLSALKFSPREMQTDDVMSLQHMVLSVLSAAACDPADIESALRALAPVNDKL